MYKKVYKKKSSFNSQEPETGCCRGVRRVGQRRVLLEAQLATACTLLLAHADYPRMLAKYPFHSLVSESKLFPTNVAARGMCSGHSIIQPNITCHTTFGDVMSEAVPFKSD